MSEGLGQRLQRARMLAGISSRELGRLARITETYPVIIESGDRKQIGVDIAAKLARVLGVSTDWLISGVGEEPTEQSVAAAVLVAREALAADDELPDSESRGSNGGAAA